MRLDGLFYEVLEVIIEYLNDYDKLSLRLVNRRFSKIRYKIMNEYKYDIEMVKIFAFENLTFYNMNHKINIEYLESIKSLKIFHFNPFIEYPPLLEKLDFYFHAKCDLKSLPSSLRFFSADEYFNESIDDLPDSIEYIWLYKYFDQKINKYPKSLKRLSVGCNYPYRSDIPFHIEIIDEDNIVAWNNFK
jgi:hypothetical protein